MSLCLALAASAIFSIHAADPAPRASGAPGPERIRAGRDEVITLRSNIFLTLVVLDQVRGEREPNGPQYQAFTKQLGRMEILARAMGKRIEEMKQRGDAYFADWEAGTSTIQDPAARERASKNFAERKKSYDLIRRSMQEAKESFFPFINYLNVIKTLLEGPRDEKRAAAARDTFMSANWRCIDVQRALMDTETELDDLAASFAKNP